MLGKIEQELTGENEYNRKEVIRVREKGANVRKKSKREYCGNSK